MITGEIVKKAIEIRKKEVLSKDPSYLHNVEIMEHLPELDMLARCLELASYVFDTSLAWQSLKNGILLGMEIQRQLDADQKNSATTVQ